MGCAGVASGFAMPKTRITVEVRIDVGVVPFGIAAIIKDREATVAKAAVPHRVAALAFED